MDSDEQDELKIIGMRRVNEEIAREMRVAHAEIDAERSEVCMERSEANDPGGASELEIADELRGLRELRNNAAEAAEQKRIAAAERRAQRPSRTFLDGLKGLISSFVPKETTFTSKNPYDAMDYM